MPRDDDIEIGSQGVESGLECGDLLITKNRNRLDRQHTEQFLPLVTLFKSNTERLVAEGRLFV